MHAAKHPEITAGILSWSPIRKLKVWQVPLAPQFCAARGWRYLCQMAAGMYTALVDGYRTQAALKDDYWTNSIHFPEYFTVLQRSAGRIKEQTTDVYLLIEKGS